MASAYKLMYNYFAIAVLTMIFESVIKYCSRVNVKLIHFLFNIVKINMIKDDICYTDTDRDAHCGADAR